VIEGGAWTGTTSAGNLATESCSDRASTAGNGHEGWPNRSGTYWTDAPGAATCSTPNRHYCRSHQVVPFWHDFEPGGFDPDWSETVGTE
jgi:hypothetical protein